MALDVESQHDEKSAGRPRLGVRFGVILIILLWSFNLNSLVGGMAGTVQAQVALHYHTTQVVWFTQVAQLLGVFTTPFTAKIAGMFGKRRVLITITVLGLGGDLISALSTNYSTLLIGRGLAGFYVPSGVLVFALARDVFPRQHIRPVSGLLAGSIGLVMFVAPFLSGTLLDNYGFRGVLWFMVIASATAVVTLLFVPESPVREPRTRVDWLGGILLGGGLTAIIYGIGNGSDWGWTSIRTLAYIIGGIAAVLAFLVAESRTAHPILPLALLGRRRVWTMLLVTTLVMGAFVGQSTVMSLLQLMPSIPHLSAGLGWTATKVAWVGAPASVLMVTTSLLTGMLARRMDSRRLLVVGALLMFLGLISAMGLAICLAVGPVLMLESVSTEEQAVAGGTQNLLQGVAIAVVTQVVFALLSQHDHVLQGTALYSDTSYRHTLWVIAAVAVVGAALTAIIPKAVRIGEDHVGAALEDQQTV
jgi:MFS family permease